MEGGDGVGHLDVGVGGAVVPFVVFAWRGEGGEVGFHVGFWRGWGGAVGGVEGEGRSALEGVGHQDEGMDEVGSGKGHEGGSHGAEVVADEAADRAVAEGVGEDHDVADEVEGAEGGEWEVGLVGGRAAVTPLVEGHDVVAGGGEREDHLAP